MGYGQQTLLGALGVIGLDLETDKTTYLVGEKPLYTITGAIPGSRVSWTSWKDEEPTSEYLIEYTAAEIGANGTLEIEGPSWVEADVGRWQKEILVTAPETGAKSRAQVFFVVRSATPATGGGTPPPATDGIFSQRINLFGYDLPLLGVLAASGIGFYLFTKKR